MAIIIQPDGTEAQVEGDMKGKNKGKFSLERLQELLGGYVQQIPTRRIAQIQGGMYPVVLANEDGKHKNLPGNRKASDLTGFRLVGPVLFLTAKEMH